MEFDFSLEKIDLKEQYQGYINLIQLPHGEYLLTYFNLETQYFYHLINREHGMVWENYPLESNKTTSITSKSIVISPMQKNFVQFINNKGELVILYNELNDESNYELFSITSSSYGKKWEDPKKISSELHSWKLSRSPIMLKTGVHFGKIILPLEDNLMQRALTLTSEDDGNSWSISLYIEPIMDDAEKDENDESTFHSYGSFQPAIVERQDGSILAIFWMNSEQILYTSISFDIGCTWDEPYPLKTIQFNKKQGFAAIKIKSEEEFLTTNIILAGIEQNDKKENKLGLYLSSDDGIIFSKIWEYEQSIPEETQIHQIYQDNENNLHIVLGDGIQTILHIYSSLPDELMRNPKD